MLEILTIAKYLSNEKKRSVMTVLYDVLDTFDIYEILIHNLCSSTKEIIRIASIMNTVTDKTLYIVYRGCKYG